MLPLASAPLGLVLHLRLGTIVLKIEKGTVAPAPVLVAALELLIIGRGLLKIRNGRRLPALGLLIIHRW